MFTKLVTAALAAFLMVATANAQQLVFGSYPGWEASAMPPEEIDFTVVSHLLHFSAKPRSDGTLNLNQHQLGADHIARTIAAAHARGRKVLLTIGGAGTAGGFVSAPRATLVRNIVTAVQQYGYDGVIIDWEPIKDWDAPTFSGFIRALRAALPGSKMLTLAVGYQWGTQGLHNTASIVAGVINSLNYIHLMAYALAGPWPGWVAWHSSALSNGGATFPGTTKPLPSAQVMVEQYRTAGVPYAKMTLGLAFFGHAWTGVFAPLQSWPAGSPPTKTGEYQYHRIIADFPSGRRWDPVSQTPYISLNPAGTANDKFVPYENPRSIGLKKAYAAQRGLGGLMIWELRGDLLANGAQPLLDALR